MMMKEFDALLKATKKIDSGKKKLIQTLDKLLSRTDKVFCITVEGEKFDFKPTFTEEEEMEMLDLRTSCILALLRKSMICGYWEPVLALAMGTDPSQLQFEKYEESEVYEIDESNKFSADSTKIDGSKPEGDENWYLKQQIHPESKWHNPVTGGKFKNLDEDNKVEFLCLCDETFVGSHIANYINSKYAKGGVLMDVGGNPPADLPEGTKTKKIDTPAQLKALVKQYPAEAQKAGLTVEKIDQEVKEAKTQMKAIGGMLGKTPSKMEYGESNIPVNYKLQPVKSVKMSKGGAVTNDLLDKGVKGGVHLQKVPKVAVVKSEPVMAVGGEPKAKKPRTQAQLDATKKLVEANRKRREKK